MARYSSKQRLDSSHVRRGYYWRFVEWPWSPWTELDGQGWRVTHMLDEIASEAMELGVRSGEEAGRTW